MKIFIFHNFKNLCNNAWACLSDDNKRCYKILYQFLEFASSNFQGLQEAVVAYSCNPVVISSNADVSNL